MLSKKHHAKARVVLHPVRAHAPLQVAAFEVTTFRLVINLVCRKLVKKYRKFSATKNVIPSESAVLMDLDPNVLEHEHKKEMAV